MAKTSGEFEKEFIETAKKDTGKSLEEWLAVVKESGLNKQMEILNWLKKLHPLNHMQSAFIAGIYLNGGKPVYANENDLLGNQFIKSPEMKPLYESVAGFILKHFPDTTIIPKKTYISFTSKREFAAINIKPVEIRLGLDLGDMPFDDMVQKTKLTGPMPRISHMHIIKDETQLNNDLLDLIQNSYKKTN